MFLCLDNGDKGIWEQENQERAAAPVGLRTAVVLMGEGLHPSCSQQGWWEVQADLIQCHTPSLPLGRSTLWSRSWWQLTEHSRSGHRAKLWSSNSHTLHSSSL